MKSNTFPVFITQNTRTYKNDKDSHWAESGDNVYYSHNYIPNGNNDALNEDAGRMHLPCPTLNFSEWHR